MIIITQHFKDRVSERYNSNIDDELENLVYIFKTAQKNISKKKRFYKITEYDDTKSINGKVYKIGIDKYSYTYKKNKGNFKLITFGKRSVKYN